MNTANVSSHAAASIFIVLVMPFKSSSTFGWWSAYEFSSFVVPVLCVLRCLHLSPITKILLAPSQSFRVQLCVLTNLRPAMVVYASTSSPWEAEAGRFL